MKKVFSKVLLLVLTLSIMITASGCTFIIDNGGVSHVEQSSSITYSNPSSETKSIDETILQSISEVDRSSVSLAITATDGLTTSYGSGTIIDIVRYDKSSNPITENAIYILTCHHMLSGMGTILITIPDSNCQYNNEDYMFVGQIGSSVYDGLQIKYNGNETDVAVTLVGSDFESDIGIVRVDLDKKAISGNKLSMSKIVKASINTEYVVKKGESVFAIGNPSGNCPGTVSRGSISYIQRQTTMENIGTMQLLQIDLTITHGSSGGGLYNMYGDLIGVTNGGSDTYIGINYAIPMCVESSAQIDNGFVNIMNELFKTYTGNNYGYVEGRKEKLGITLTQKEEDSTTILCVSSVMTNSEGESVGIKVNDILTNAKLTRGGSVIVNKAISTLAGFNEVASNFTIGDVLVLTVTRTTGNYFVKTETKELTFNIAQYHFCDTGK